MNAKAFVAEGIGTFALTFIGAGAGAVGVGGVVGAAFAHGLVCWVSPTRTAITAARTSTRP